MRDKLVSVTLFLIIAIMTMTTVIYARNAETESKRVANKIDNLSLTAQNRCMIKVVLSYPPPIGQDQYDVVLGEYDQCIEEQTEEGSK